MRYFPIINDSLGTASLIGDGTLKLVLVRNKETRFNFSTVLKIRRDNPRYQKYLDQIGGIGPGERKSIPPMMI